MNKDSSSNDASGWIKYANSIVALVLMYFAISSFEGMVARHQANANESLTISSWAPLGMMLIFGASWFIVDLFESALIRLDARRILFLLALLIVGVVLLTTNRLYINQWFLNELLSVTGFDLWLSAGLLRYALFKPEALTVVRRLWERPASPPE